MPERLVTIATFDQPAKARLAQNALAEVGIRAALGDAETVAMDWLLGNAIGWVKVQVLEPDAERAVAALNEVFGEDGKGFGHVAPDDLAAQAEAAPPEGAEDDEGETPARPAPTPATPVAVEVPAATEPADDTPTERDDYARRAFYSAVFGLLVPLLPFYALYLLMNVASGEGVLSRRGRRHTLVAAVLTTLGLSIAYLFMRLMGSA